MKEQERKTQSSSRSSIFMSEEGRAVASSDGNHSEYEFSEDEAYDHRRFSLSEDVVVGLIRQEVLTLIKLLSGNEDCRR